MGSPPDLRGAGARARLHAAWPTRAAPTASGDPGLHCAARRYDETDRAAIVRIYERLITVMPTPVVALNRAVAVAETKGPAAGLVLLDDIAEELDGYHLLHAGRGSMLERLGRPHQAAEAYDRAAALARTDAEVSFLSRASHSAHR